MALNIPTTKQLFDAAKSLIESKLNQSTPVNDKAFNNVLAGIIALDQTGLYKFAAERSKQNLALTATGEDLDNIGAEYGVNRKTAEATILEIQATGSDGNVIPATSEYVGDANGLIYFPDSANTITGGVAQFNITASEPGTVGNLQPGNTVSLTSPIAGVQTQATIILIANTGAEEESDDDYRQRVLTVIRNIGGGGNAFDYRRWSEEVAGVRRAYPY